MTSRDAILEAIRLRRVRSAPRPGAYRRPSAAPDPIEAFVANATRAAAEVRRLNHLGEVPSTIADILRARNMKAEIHFPAESSLANGLPWDRAPGLTRSILPPGPDDAAVAVAPYGISETGTLAYASRTDAPASWHFRPGLEIAVIRASTILSDFEAVLARAKADGWPATLNLVTGPSRTGDIEQTLELGAHGPKALVVLVVEG